MNCYQRNKDEFAVRFPGSGKRKGMQSAAMHFAPSIFDSFPSEDFCVVIVDEKWAQFFIKPFFRRKSAVFPAAAG